MTHPLLIAMITMVLAVVLGLLSHEGVHYFLGRRFGGEPYVSRTLLRYLPREIDFEKPKNMEPWQVRLTGGGVLIFPALFVLWSIIAYALLYSSIPVSNTAFAYGLLLLIYTGSASLVSWFDLLAAQEPEKWKSYTTGGEISRLE